jgi:aspartate/methionine/tyrosine aminotransferase
MNPRLLHIKESATIKIADIARKMERSGIRVVKLQTGDPDFDTPSIITDAAYQAMKEGLTHYSESRGLPTLRKALAEKLRKDNNVIFDPDREILVTHGAAHGIFITMQSLISPGDEVILIEPYYMSYAASIQLAGGVPIPIRTNPNKDFVVDIENIRASISPRTKIIVLNSPCNPSGVVLGSETIQAIKEIVMEHNLFILSDEVYEHIIFDGRRNISISSLPDMHERTIIVNSFSKTYAMTGWRIGYLAAPAYIVDQMLKVLQYSATNIAPFTQRAAIVALQTPELLNYIEMMRDTYNKRRLSGLSVVEEFQNLRVVKPAGAFYLMVDVSQCCLDSFSFASQLLEQEHVAVVPGSAFGESSEGWIRLTFAVPQEIFMEGIRRIGRFAKTQI